MAPKAQPKNDPPEAAAGTTEAPDDSSPPADVQIEASTEETQPTPPAAGSDDGNKIVTTVWAPQGQVPKASILQTAIQSVRNAIPIVFELEAEISGAEKTTSDDGQPGTAFEVTITYTPRATVGGKDEPVDVDKVIRGLDVPRSFDGIAGHDGDPDFLERQPAEKF